MARHLIYRQKVMLNLSGRQEALALQEKVSRLVKNELADSLESALDQAFPPDKIVRIDTLQLDLGAISLQNFENEFKDGFIGALIKSLSAKSENLAGAAAGDRREEMLSKPQSLKDTLFFFLQKGYLPWYSPDWKINDWEAQILSNFSEEEYRQLIKWLRDNYIESPVVLDRLVFQFSDRFIETLMLKIKPGFDKQWPLIFADYHFILTNLLKPSAKAKKPEEDVWQNPDFRHIIYDFQAIRDKIWQFTLRVWLDAGFNEPVEKILGLLLAWFGIGRTHFGQIKQTEITESIRTEAVKKTFEKIVLRDGKAGEEEKYSPNKPKNKPEDVRDISKPAKTTGKNDDRDGADLTGEDRADGKKAKKHTASPVSHDQQPLSKADDEENDENGFVEGDPEAQAAAQAFLNKTAKKDTPRVSKKNQPEQGDIVTANNCGIVILNPFFKRYFEDLGLVNEGEFISEAARGRAVLLLHYLATGETTAAEFDLALQKVLCGYPADETLETSVKLTKREKSESEKLLKAVIGYWEPLKNTSIAGLRGTFLCRTGNLELKESGWLLKIEQKTVDILLGKLPWGFSTIRLRWMKKMLSVDWY